MAFIKYIPYGNKTPNDLYTTCSPEIQIWQELSAYRHLKANSSIYGKLVTSPWIDQSKTYFQDACLCSWNSRGLLYYYSFLNLAKAFIVSKRAISANKLKSTSIYHGLSTKTQSPSKIIDFEIDVHPPVFNNKHNIFAHLYQKITNASWPFRNSVSIKISEIISYITLISYEVDKFYNIQTDIVPIQSLIRVISNKLWFEMLIQNYLLTKVTTYLSPPAFTVVPYNSFIQKDVDDWYMAYEKTPQYLSNCSILRSSQLIYNQNNRSQQALILQKSINKSLENNILPQSIAGHNESFWDFVPDISLVGTKLKWHPILSNYLFAFMLSTILRYHPHIFDSNKKDAFLAQAWCNQSAIITLRYFLMEFSKNNLRMN